MSGGFWSGPAEPRDAEELLEDIRPEDRSEWIAAGCVSTRAALMASIGEGQFARVARKDTREGPVLCIWGVVPSEADPKLGTAWLIGTKTGAVHARGLHRILRREFAELVFRWPRLQCWADDRNTTHHVWIKWLGFSAGLSKPFGPYGLPFTYYLRE